MTGVIYSIVYQPDGQDDPKSVDYVRVPLSEASLVAGYGIQGDRKGGHHPQRHVNLLSYEWLVSLKPKGYRTEPGQFGEQLIIQGLAVEDLKPGDHLQLGEQAVIEITKPRTGCERLEAAQGRSIDELRASVGMLAKVVGGGKIHVGDPVTLISRPLTTAD